MIKHFNYHLTGNGWAEAFFSNETQNIRFDLSYLSDPISDLIDGLLRLINNQSAIENIDFFEEPGKHLLKITKCDNNGITVQIYLSWFSEESNSSKNELIYSDTDTLSNFSKTICTGIDSLLERHTLKDYKENWILYKFPDEHFTELKQKFV